MRLARIGDVALVNPRAPAAPMGADDEVVSFVPMGSVSEDGRIADVETTKFAFVGSGYTYFERGDVLLAKITPCMENGKAAHANELPTRIGFGSTEFHVLRPGPNADGRYLFHLVWNPRFRFFAERAMTGSAGQKRVPADFVRSYEIPLPEVSEQRRIATILDKADAIRRKRQQAIKLADDLLRSVFLDMFGDPLVNPRGWPSVRLKAVTTKIGSGSTPRGGEAAYVNEGVSLIRSLNVHDDCFVWDGLAHITDEQAQGLALVSVEAGDILLNITGASVCRCAMVPESALPARVNQHVCIVRADVSQLRSEYLLGLFLSASYKRKLLMIAGAGGATREALTKQQIEELDIPLPPREMQDHFAGLRRKLESTRKMLSAAQALPLFESLRSYALGEWSPMRRRN